MLQNRRQLNRSAIMRMALAVCAACTIRTALADHVRVGGTDFANARIQSFDQGHLTFRAADGTTRRVWIGDVNFINVDSVRRFADFNEAEQFLAQQEPEKSIVRYERTIRTCEGFWVDLTRTRLLMACDRAGRIDEAAVNLVRVLQGRWAGPAVAAACVPENIPDHKNDAVLRALDRLQVANRATDAQDHTAVLTLAEFAIRQATGDSQVDELSRTLAHMPMPEAVRCTRAYGLQREALARVPASEFGIATFRTLDDAIAHCPDELLPEFLLLKGDVLLARARTSEELIRAAWPYMRVVIHKPSTPAADRALVGAAAALERLDRPDKARQLLEECLSRTGVPVAVRNEAATALKRLREASGND